VQRAPIVPLALAFTGGIAAELRGFGLMALVLGPALGFALRRVSTAARMRVLVAMACGITVAALRGEPVFPAAESRSHEHGAVVVEHGASSDGDEVTLRLDDGRLLGASFNDAGALDIGTRLRLRARYEPPDEARNPGEPSPREFAAERGLAGRLTHVRVEARQPPDPADASLWFARARAWAGTRLRERLAEPYATILAGALWGERGALPPDLRTEFQDTGTVHVLVTAGLHLGVIAALAVWLARMLGAGRIGASLAAIAVVWLYAVFSGAHLPSLRAATMATFFLAARAAGRPALSWNALALAAIVVALLRPAAVLSLSFELSFSCVGAIVLFAEPFAEALERIGLPAFVDEALALTFATQLGTWPLTASAFLVIAPYAPLANALVVPVVGIAMLVGVAELAATPLPFLAQALANVETSLLGWIVGVVRTVGTLPGAHVIATPPPGWAIALYDLGLVCAAAFLARGARLGAAVLIVAGCALCAWPPRHDSHLLRITAIDVGQADALLIQTPRGHTYLVDAGGRLERGAPGGGNASPAEAIGERIVVPFLVRHGIHHVDAILISHPHGDHVGGAGPVLRTLGADFFADSGQTYAGHAYRDALGTARTAHVPIVDPRGGNVWHTDDGVTLRFYGPTLPFLTGTKSDINSNSLVFRLEYGRFRMLFTGDAGSEAEARMLEAGDDLAADVLKVGHHGSAYSSTRAFIERVHPRAAVISVGRDNLFGHPARSTLETLERSGAAIFRTDEDGAIEIESDGGGFRVAPFIQHTAEGRFLVNRR
jgi:competence protein ComEC